MEERPLILICNDDSIDSKGIHFLVDCVKDFGEVYVVAPDGPRSGQSSAITCDLPLHVHPHPDYEGARMFSVSGTPVDCVKLSMHHILPRRPDLMLAGVNHGSNAGNCVIYSGTMGAVMEACMVGVPAIGYSLLSHAHDADFSACRSFIREITSAVITNGLPGGVCLNVNFPSRGAIDGLKVVSSAKSHWTEEYKEYFDPHGHPFYWLTGSLVNEEPDNEGTDLYWLDRNHATVVPTRVDQNASEAIPAVKKMLGV